MFMNEKQMPIFSPRLKALRLEARLSQNRLARFADLDRGTLSKAEKGEEIADLTASKIISALSEHLKREIMLDEVTISG